MHILCRKRRRVGMEVMGKTLRRKQERFAPVEIKIIHTDKRVHLKEGPHIITVMFDFNPGKHDLEPWIRMTRQRASN